MQNGHNVPNVGIQGPQYRQQCPGELYAVYLVGAGPVFLLGTFPPDEPVDSRDRWYSGLDELLDGWADHCNAMDGLTWVMDRLQSPTRVSP